MEYPRIERKLAMSILRFIVIAFALFSKIPMPRVEWTKANMQYMLCAFPLWNGYWLDFVGVDVAL